MSITAFLLIAGGMLSAELKTVPTFENCSLYWSGSTLPDTHTVQICEANSTLWIDALPLTVTPDYPEWRGSVFDLKEDTSYSVRIMDGTKTLAVQSFRTWTSAPPIAKHYTLNDLSPDGRPVVFTEQGSADGWIYISGTPDCRLLDGGENADEALLFTNAAYVIFENITVRGGIKYGITVQESENIRILNCDIAGFGRVGEQRLRYGGTGQYYDNNSIINDAGINIDDSENVVVERCFIHSPRGTSNPWRFAHPTGPNAVFVKSRGGTVLRYNDFPGSSLHRWNDVIQGYSNYNHGFLRNGDLYGNLLVFANDDAVELDGLQMNIRAYGNRIEETYCGVSIGPCIAGPSYVFRNLIANLGDEDGFSNASFKAGSAVYGYGRVFYLNNTVAAKYKIGSTIGTMPDDAPEQIAKVPGYAKMNTRNNVLSSRQFPITQSWIDHPANVDYDLLYSTNSNTLEAVKRTYMAAGQCAHAIFSAPEFADTAGADYALAAGSPGAGKAIAIPGISGAGNDVGAFANDTIFEQIPIRPLPVALDKGRILLGESPVAVTAVTAPDADAAQLNFTIRKPADCDWFSVTPGSGALVPGQEQIFTVLLNTDALPKSRRGAGTFLVRFASGLSRPVLVFTEDLPPPAVVQLPENCWSRLIEAEHIATPGTDPEFSGSASGGGYAVVKKNSDPFTVTFTIPADGDYQVCLRLKTLAPPGESITAKLTWNGEPVVLDTKLRADEGWTWSGVRAPNQSKNQHYGVFRMTKGTHTFSFVPDSNIAVDAVLITDSMLGNWAPETTYTYYNGSTATAGLGMPDNWGAGLPSDDNDITGIITNNVNMPLSSTIFSGWKAIQTAGTISRGGLIMFHDGAHWTLQGGTITSGQHIAIGYSNTAGTVVMTGGTLTANTNFLIQAGGFVSQSGGTLTFGGQAQIGSSANGAGTVNIFAGTGTFNTAGIAANGLAIAGAGSRLTFFGGNWTVAGNLNFGNSLGTNAGLCFDAGDGSLTVDSLSFNGGYINFMTGSEGRLTVTGFSGAADFEAWWDAGRIRRNGSAAGDFSSLFQVIDGKTLLIR
ncbi:MAG: right-handed parallel beta-helix repeat-containing protein [Kiritimatiellales bacterium]